MNFKAVLALPKTAGSAKTHKSVSSIELFGALYMNISAGHMSFLTGQDRTPKFAGWVLRDRTKFGLTFLNILGTK